MKTIEKIKKYTFGTILTTGCVKTVGFKSEDDYYIDKTTYLFGKIINYQRIWRPVNKKQVNLYNGTDIGFLTKK